MGHKVMIDGRAYTVLGTSGDIRKIARSDEDGLSVETQIRECSGRWVYGGEDTDGILFRAEEIAVLAALISNDHRKAIQFVAGADIEAGRMVGLDADGRLTPWLGR